MTETDQREWQPTACILCECNCGIVVQLDDRTLAKIRGDKDHPASQGYTCNKALRLDHYQNNRNRLTSPMRRRADGSYEEIDWDTAIAEIAEGFARDPRRRTAATRSSTTAAAGRATTSAAPTAARSSRRSARATARMRWRRRRPASTGSTRTSTAATPAASSSTPRCRCSSARTRGCRRASRAPASCSTRSPRTRRAR